ncbi:hypothetical protein BKA83DRAFT_4284465, partial [Pisolithus microcarpus]
MGWSVGFFLPVYLLYHFLPFCTYTFSAVHCFLACVYTRSGCVYTTVLACCLFQIQSYISDFLFLVSPLF